MIRPGLMQAAEEKALPGVLTLSHVKKEAGEYDAEVIRRVKLQRLGLRSLGSALETCVNLQTLSLAHNSLIQISGLSTLTQLISLDLAHNKLARVGNSFESAACPLFITRSIDRHFSWTS